MTTTTGSAPVDAATALADAEALVAQGRPLEAIEVLAPVAGAGDIAIDGRLAEIRYAAFGALEPAGFPSWPAEAAGVDRSGPAVIPEVTPAELDADVARRHVLSRGSVLVRGLFVDHVRSFVEGIDAALAARASAAAGEPFDRSLFRPLPLPKEEARSLGRHWVAGSGGLLTCDSPQLLQRLFAAYEDVGLRDVIGGYLGERPVLSGNKCTLRRVPTTANTDWHQDGAFLGSDVGIRALNVWIALTDCGVDAPGMDLVPKRFEAVVETGTGGAIFDWAVGPDTVTAVAPDAPPVRPQFRAGDALLFDDLFLHRTAIEPSMTHARHAIESWFFAATDYPSGQVPIVW